MRRLPTLGLALVLLATLLSLASPAGAGPAAPAETDRDPGRVSIVEVEGLIDAVVADYVEESITAGERADVVAVVLRMDSGGAVVSDARLADLGRRIHQASVPVTVWVGPSGSQATGGAAQLAGAGQRLGLAPGARLGKTGKLVVDEGDLARPFLAARDRLKGGTVNDADARKLGLVPDQRAAVIGDFLIDLPGFDTEVVTVDGKPQRQPRTIPVFSSLPVQDQLFHTVASPAAAYLLFVIGLALIVFELYTAGVGIAGLVGAGSFLLGCYGFAALPVRPVGVGLLVLSILGFTIDVQTGVPRLWSVIGAVSLVAGSLLLYDGYSLSWITLLVGVVGVSIFMVVGMPAMVRTRFSTPTIGREWMIGEEGEAVTAVDPDGVVRLRGALWRARTNRATPLALSDGVRVVEVDGLLLEVEPLEGGAVD